MRWKYRNNQVLFLENNKFKYISKYKTSLRLFFFTFIIQLQFDFASPYEVRRSCKTYILRN